MCVCMVSFNSKELVSCFKVSKGIWGRSEVVRSRSVPLFTQKHTVRRNCCVCVQVPQMLCPIVKVVGVSHDHDGTYTSIPLFRDTLWELLFENIQQ